jgi:hypothetical protein
VHRKVRTTSILGKLGNAKVATNLGQREYNTIHHAVGLDCNTQNGTIFFMDKGDKMLDYTIWMPYHIKFFWMHEHVNSSICQVSFHLTNS